jgi:hypothetical protein
MLLWQEHRPELTALDALSRVAGIGSGWQQKIVQRLDWLRKLAE